MEFMCGAVDICVYGLGAKINTARGTDVINLGAVKRSKRALNVYFREFSRPQYLGAKQPNRRRSLEFDYEMQFERRDSSRRSPDFHSDVRALSSSTSLKTFKIMYRAFRSWREYFDEKF